MGCLILMRVKDKVPPGHPSYHKLFQKGDVICVVPEGWSPGRLELASDEVLWLKCDMTQEEAEHEFCAAEPGDPIKNPNLRRRAAKFDETLIPQVLKEKVAANVGIPTKDAEQKEKPYEAVAAEFEAKVGYAECVGADLLAARVVKEKVENQFDVGADPFTVG